MMNRPKVNCMEDKGLRGRAAIEAAHSSLAGADEPRLNSTISSIYGVDAREALEIHADFHRERIYAMLLRRALQYGMPARGLTELQPRIELAEKSLQVASGSLTEAAATDLLFAALRAVQSNGKIDDRYIAFYG